MLIQEHNFFSLMTCITFFFHFHSLVLVFSLKQVRFCLSFMLAYLTRSRWSLISRLAGFVHDMTWNVKRSYCYICWFSVCEKNIINAVKIMRSDTWGIQHPVDKVWWGASWRGDLTRKKLLKLTKSVPQFTFLLYLNAFQ